MLRRRLITVLTFNEGVLFRTKQFVPDYRYTHNFVDAWLVDELVALDVTRPRGLEAPSPAFASVVGGIARKCFVPLAAGGGIRTLEDARRFMALGADKVVVNTGALERPALIGEIAGAYGAQSVVASIDARRSGRGYEVFSHNGTRPTGRDPADWAEEAVAAGAGEILVTSIEYDGSLAGYDLELCRRVANRVPVPVLIAGGAGSWKHFVQGIIEGGASGVCTSNIYHFTESSIRSAKLYMSKAGLPVRLS